MFDSKLLKLNNNFTVTILAYWIIIILCFTDSSSGDEFADSDSNDSSNGNLPNNTAILIGPHGCGKTAAVYAVANELGCKV